MVFYKTKKKGEKIKVFYIQIKKKIIMRIGNCNWLDFYHICLAATCLVLRDQVPAYVTVEKKPRKTVLQMKSSMTELSEFFLCSPIYATVHKHIPGAYICMESCMVNSALG